MISGCEGSDDVGDRWEPASSLPDLSGLVWVSDNLFLAAHDSKVLEEDARPRISLVRLSGSTTGTTTGTSWRPIEVRWPASQTSSDLESASAIPGTPFILLAESGDDGGPHQAIFLAELVDDSVVIAEVVDWPIEIFNVEGMAVARIGDGHVFLYAERSHDSLSTRIRWATLQTGPLAFGTFREVTFSIPASAGMNRPVSAIDVDPDGWIYVASAFDPDVDDGPYSSLVWRIGRLRGDDIGQVAVELDSVPRLLARLDGIKIESLAIRTRPDGSHELIIGSDDENLGAIIRPLAPREDFQ